MRPAKAGIFSGSQSYRSRSQERIAYGKETKRMKLINQAILGVSESPGRNESEPTSGLGKT